VVLGRQVHAGSDRLGLGALDLRSAGDPAADQFDLGLRQFLPLAGRHLASADAL